jgi:hypothetical protein
MLRTLLYGLLIGLSSLVAAQCANENQTPPADKTQAAAITACDPNQSAPPITAEIDQLLDQVEQHGATLKSYQADMFFRQEQRLLDVAKVRHGSLLYQIDNDRVRFRIHFADLQAQDLEDTEPAPVVTFDEDYAFDGLWFTIRNARLKNIQKQEVCKTPAKKEEFRLGRGPFPLPFSIQKADVLKDFDVSLIPPDSNAPADVAHLMLKPKKDSSFAEQYVNLEMWISKQSFVPVQMRFEKEDAEITSIVWSSIVLDQPIDAKKFEPGPAGDDWTVETTPLPPDSPPAVSENIR